MSLKYGEGDMVKVKNNFSMSFDKQTIWFAKFNIRNKFILYSPIFKQQRKTFYFNARKICRMLIEKRISPEICRLSEYKNQSLNDKIFAIWYNEIL